MKYKVDKTFTTMNDAYWWSCGEIFLLFQMSRMNFESQIREYLTLPLFASVISFSCPISTKTHKMLLFKSQYTQVMMIWNKLWSQMNNNKLYDLPTNPGPCCKKSHLITSVYVIMLVSNTTLCIRTQSYKLTTLMVYK